MPIIRSGRCDECRRRRKKCNEVRPTCSLCTIAGLQCVYSNKITSFVHTNEHAQSRSSLPSADHQVTLQLRSSRDVPGGVGCYQRFAPCRTKVRQRPHLVLQSEAPVCLHSPPPMSSAVRLSSEFTLLLGLDATSQHCCWLWQDWSIFIPSRIGSSPLLDCAVACVLETCRSIHTANDQAEKKARRYYAQALVILQYAVSSASLSLTGEDIAAMKLLETFETTFNKGKECWLSHANGAVRTFLALGPKSCQQDFERALFYSTFGTVFLQGLSIGEPSPFDTADWLDIGPPPMSLSLMDPVESHRRFKFMTKIPRLANLIRVARANPNDAKILSKTTLLLQDVLNLEWQEEFPPGGSATSGMTGKDLALPPNSSQSPRLFFEAVLLHFVRWTCRIMLCGLCQSAHNVGLHLGWPPIEELRRVEQECAVLICTTISNMRIEPWTQNIAAVFFPAQVAWGALWRRTRGDGKSDDDLFSWLEAWIWAHGSLLDLALDHRSLLQFTRCLDGSPLDGR